MRARRQKSEMKRLKRITCGGVCGVVHKLEMIVPSTVCNIPLFLGENLNELSHACVHVGPTHTCAQLEFVASGTRSVCVCVQIVCV